MQKDTCNTHHEERCTSKEILTLLKFTMNAKNFYLPQGYYLVSDLKKLGGVSDAHVLAEIKNGEIDDLANDCAVLINGCEDFKSYPGKGENS